MFGSFHQNVALVARVKSALYDCYDVVVFQWNHIAIAGRRSLFINEL